MNDLTLVVSTLDNSMADVQTMLSKKLDIFTNISTTSSLPQVGSYIIVTSGIRLTLPTPQETGQLITLYSGLTGANTYTLNNGAASANTTTISSGTVTLCISTGTSIGNWVAYSSGLLVTFV
jgi:TRAP-type C4-dicarboxylate transport system permease large subunit